MKMLSEEIEEISSKLSELSIKVPNRIEMLKKEVDLCEAERLDILHKIEFSKCNAYQGWKLYQDLKITLEARRRAKDELLSLTKLNERLEKSDTLASQTKNIATSMKDLRRNHVARTYSVRVRKDFIDNKKMVGRPK